MIRIFLAVICGAIITVYGAAGVLLRSAAGGDAGVERTLCANLLYCDDEVARAEVHRRLWSGEQDDEASAVREAMELLRRSPASAERWCTLGDAYLQAGEPARARAAYAQSLEWGPNSPPILMRAANFAWELGDTSGYLRHTERVLSLVTDYDAVIFDGYRRVGADAGQILKAELASNPEAAARYSAYLSEAGFDSNAP